MISTRIAALSSLLLGSVAMAQNINIDFGLPGAGPPATYAAAGLPGMWNSIEGTHNQSFVNPTIIYNLVDINGNPTPVTLFQFGGLELLLDGDPSVSGDDAVLLNDCIVTHTQNLETCLFINGLQNGTYEVLTYAWMPNHPTQLAKVRYDFDQVHQPFIGGAWPGQHVEGVTYARHVVNVTTGFMGGHSGNVFEGNLEIGAALNGMQIRRLDDCPAAPSIVEPIPGVSVHEHTFDGYIDPRLESNNGKDLNRGLMEFVFVFDTPMRDADGASLTAASFAIEHTAPWPAPNIIGIETDDDMHVAVLFDRPIYPGHWTTITTTAVSQCGGEPVSGPNSIRVGFLPGDIDQNEHVTPLDFLFVRQYFLSGDSPQEFGVVTDYYDTDRNGHVAVLDFKRMRQILVGSSPATQVWMGESLP